MSFAQPFSNYEILDRVGAGAMGTVFKARQKHLGRIVALKVLKPSLARDKRYVERLRREARIVGRLNHPNIVTAYDLGEEGGYHFFVMEFVDGQSLRHLLTEWGMFPEDKVLDVALQITDALAHAFEIGVIHRDIKPANVLIDGKGKVKLTDMGLAKAKTDLTLTRDGATVGTPQYLSPEQARDPQAVDVRSDLYSLGATLFHMATGQPPFRADTIGELITKVLHDGPPSVTELNPELSGGLSLVIRKLLVKDRERRYQSPRELLEDLARVRRHERPEVDPQLLDAPGGAVTHSIPPARRTARALLPSAVFGLLGVLLGGVGAWWWVDDPSATADAVWGQHAERVAVLQAELGALRSPRQRLARLERAAVASGGAMGADLEAAWRQAVDALRAVELAEMGAALAELLETWEPDTAAFDVGAESTVDPSGLAPTNAAERAEQQLARALRERFGFGPGELPTAEMREQLASWRGDFAVRLGAQLRERETDLDLRHRAWIRDVVRPLVERELAAGRFAGVRSEVERQLAAFLSAPAGAAGQRIGARLRGRFDAREEELRARVEQQVAGQRVVAAERLRQQGDGSLSVLERLAGDLERRGADPWPLRVAVDRLEQRLRRNHPGPAAFLVGNSPWDELLPRLAILRERIATAADLFQQQRAADCLDLAYRLFDDAGPTLAEQSLAALLADDVAWEGGSGSRLRRHRELFAAVEGRVAELVAAAEGGALSVAGGLLREGARLERDADRGLVVLTGARGRGWRDIAWDELVPSRPDTARGTAGAERVDVGPAEGGDAVADAFLLLVADQPVRARPRVSAEDWVFLQTEVWPRLAAAPVAAEAGERAARLAVQQLWRAYDAEQRDVVRGLLESFEKEHARSQAARGAAGLRARLVSWLEQSEPADAGLRRLAARAPQGFRIGRGEDGVLWCAGEVGRSDTVTADPSWEIEDEARAHREAGGPGGARTVGELAVGGLVVPSPFARGEPVEATVEVRIPARDREPSMVWLDLHEGWVAVAVLPSGVVVAAVPDGNGGPEDGADLGRALAQPIREVAVRRLAASGRVRSSQVVDGAWHRLRIRVEPRRGGDVRVRAWLDGESEELCSRELSSGEWSQRQPQSWLRVRTADSFAVREVHLQGRLGN